MGSTIGADYLAHMLPTHQSMGRADEIHADVAYGRFSEKTGGE